MRVACAGVSVVQALTRCGVFDRPSGSHLSVKTRCRCHKRPSCYDYTFYNTIRAQSPPHHQGSRRDGGRLHRSPPLCSSSRCLPSPPGSAAAIPTLYRKERKRATTLPSIREIPGNMASSIVSFQDVGRLRPGCTDVSACRILSRLNKIELN